MLVRAENVGQQPAFGRSFQATIELARVLGHALLKVGCARDRRVRQLSRAFGGGVQALLHALGIVLRAALQFRQAVPRDGRDDSAFGSLVQTDLREPGIIRPVVDIAEDKVGILFRWDAPARLQPRLEFVFLSVWRTVS